MYFTVWFWAFVLSLALFAYTQATGYAVLASGFLIANYIVIAVHRFLNVSAAFYMRPKELEAVREEQDARTV